MSPTQENIIWDKTVTVFIDTPTLPSHIIIFFKIRFKHTFESEISPFHYLVLGLWLGLGLQSNQPLTRNRYISLHATTQVDYYFYFYVLCKYYHTNEDKGVLENPYSSQVLHTNKYGLMLGNPIQDYQRKIPLR